MRSKSLKNNLIHPTALVESQSIGEGTRIWAFVHILEDAVLGKNCNICDHCFIENNVVLGNNVTIKSGVWLWDGVTIEDDVYVGPSVVFTNDLHPRSGNRNYEMKHTVLKKGCSIGAGTVLLPGVCVGNYAMIGAGSVVTKNVPNYELWYGNPAKKQGCVCQCGMKLIEGDSNKDFTCSCGLSYVFQNDVLQKVTV